MILNWEVFLVHAILPIKQLLCFQLLAIRLSSINLVLFIPNIKIQFQAISLVLLFLQ
mgnify:CR=1 FL=1